MDNKQAFLVLADGGVLPGVSVGIKGITVGELIFNTANVGYQEALTDPSYTGQIIVFTTPHIGNTGCNLDDWESNQFQAAGLVLREQPLPPTHWKSQIDFQKYLENNFIVGIAEIDTRYLTRLLRDKGNISACIVSDSTDIVIANQLATTFSEISSSNLLEKVSVSSQYLYGLNSSKIEKEPHIVVYDFGVKRNILRILDELECRVTVVPALTPAYELNSLEPDGIILSNGPGDPLAYTSVIDIVRNLILSDIPILGICLGHQLLGIALGARIEKLKFGHHGINHPIIDLNTGRVLITSQNHNFVLSDMGLPNDITVTYRSLFDSSIQGIQHKFKSLFGLQGHPEACPGPTELSIAFNQFLSTVRQYEKKDIKQCQNSLT